MSLEEQLDHAWRQLDPLQPIEPGDPQDWYEDLSEVRAVGDFTRTIARRIGRQADRPQRVLITGHRGCGKSTELGRLDRRLSEAGFQCVRVEVDESLDLKDIDIVDVQVILVRQVGAQMVDLDLALPTALLERVSSWFFEEERTSEQTQATSFGVKGETPKGLMSSLFKDLLPKFSADLRISQQHRTRIREKVQKDLPSFVKLVADVVLEAKGVLQENDFKGLVVLIDGLEKAVATESGAARVADVLITHAEQWGELAVPLVFTGPLELYSEQNRMQNDYDEVFLMPAVPVEPRTDRPDDDTYAVQGRELLTNLVKRRVDVDVIFSSSELLERLVRASGGSIRDLFRLIRGAIDEAFDRAVSDDDITEAIKQQRLQMRAVLTRADRSLLTAVHKNPEDFDLSPQSLPLLHRELVVPYSNGDVWYGVHPSIVDQVTEPPTT
jgi:energy-coupling factor transporter ATP-binding protein EcfA2